VSARPPGRPATPVRAPRRASLPVTARLAERRRRWPVLSGLAALAALAVVLPLALSAGPASSAVPLAATAAEVTVDEAQQGAPEEVRTPPTVGGPGTPAGDGRMVTVQAGGLERSYLLLPALGLEPGTPAPLLVVLHQDIASPAAVAVNLGLDVLRRDGVTLAYPAGIGGSWAAGACCGIAQERGVDDVAFVDEVLRDAPRRTPVDRRRAAVLGYSGGGMLLYKLLCRPHEPLVAAVEVNGSLEAHCPDGTRLPDLLALHGERDGSVGMHRPVFVNHLGMAPRTVTSTLSTITAKAGCGTRTARSGANVDHVLWTGCRGGSTVDAVIVKAAGHRWEDVDGVARARSWLLPRLRGA
jgi:polyhydroxybutyrate depolymerase